MMAKKHRTLILCLEGSDASEGSPNYQLDLFNEWLTVAPFIFC